VDITEKLKLFALAGKHLFCGGQGERFSLDAVAEEAASIIANQRIDIERLKGALGAFEPRHWEVSLRTIAGALDALAYTVVKQQQESEEK
jgi:hypothetical protein